MNICVCSSSSNSIGGSVCVWMCKIVNKMEGRKWVVFDLLIDVNDYGVGGEPKELY